MGDIEKRRKALGEVSYPPEVKRALQAVTELPEDPEKQAGFFDKVQEALGSRKVLGEVSYPPEVERALQAVTELPEDPEKQAEFFDKVHEALGNRLRDDS